MSLHEVKLKTDQNAWKPRRLQSDIGKSQNEQKDTEKLYNDVRGILNKLTPQKFETLMKKFLLLPINTEERLIGVVTLIYNKAAYEPSFSKSYANMCKICSKMEVSKVENGQEQKENFRKIIINRCQTEFESNKSSGLDAAKWLQEIENCTDPKQKKKLQLEYEEKKRDLLRKAVGNVRFIGELFKLGMLTPAIMYRCIDCLLSTPDEESLECLCELLTTIGKDLEYGQGNQKQPQPGVLNQYLKRMAELAQMRESSQISWRVRFMLQDVIELWQNKWVPRKEGNNPKTIEQINKDAERESTWSMEISILLQQHRPSRMNRQDDWKRNNRGGNNKSHNNGWVTPSSRYHSKTPVFEAPKMQNMVKNEMGDMNSLSLSGRSQFIFNTTSKSMESKSGPVFVSNNIYSALEREKKPSPQSSMNNRRITPTTSIEKDKERQSMILGALESDGRNSRGSSMQRERPTLSSSQPQSRDSSIPRQPYNKETERHDKRDNKMEERLQRQSQTLFDEFLGELSTVETMKEKKSHDESVEEMRSEDEFINNSSTSMVEPIVEKEAEIQLPSMKEKNLNKSEDLPSYVKQAMLLHLSHNTDEEQVFGEFCASELRQIKNPANKRMFKQIVLEAVSNIGEAEALGVVYKPQSLNTNNPLLTAMPSSSFSSNDNSSPFLTQN